ncbi:sugar ABC transporter substrate-binding protein [Amycolatopsis japonica]|uniref:sugar ABC transporter substrate-binding protein n=1 Tax=Amycolatopsis japonica TaxID=208439 RepID=UPI003671A472
MGTVALARADSRRPAARRLLALVSAGLLAVLAACGTGPGVGDSGEAKDAGQPLKLGLSLPALDTPFFSVLVADATAAAQAAGGSVVQTTNANRDSGQQVTDFRNLITAGANAIMAGVVDTKAIKPALDYAKSQGVPVVIVDDQPTAGDVYAVVKADNVSMGNSAADKLGQLLPRGGKVLQITGDPSTSNGRDRQSGFEDTIKAKYPNIQVITQNGKWDGPTSGNIMNAVLSQNPDLAGVYMASDTLYFDPVSAALNGRGRLVPAGQNGHVVITGIDGGVSALKGITGGTLDATVAQPVDAYAKCGVQYLVDARSGKKITVGPTDHQSTVVQKGAYMVDQLPAPLVTKDNVKDPNLWGNKAGVAGK